MLDQTINAEIIKAIFERENRKGNIPKSYFPDGYLDKKKELKEKNKELKLIKGELDYKKEIEKEIINDELKENDEYLKELFNKIAIDIGSKKIFHSLLIKKNENDNKPTYQANNIQTYFAFKWIIILLKKTFKCYPSNRDTILTELKLLLNDETPKYLIRTDISKFYETIPQNILLNKICLKGLLCPQAEKIIRTTFYKFNCLKENKVDKLGIPRGICFSSYLAEIYMKDIDSQIKNIPDIFYYARYVDDIIVLAKPSEKGVKSIYEQIKLIIEKNELKLKEESSEKTYLIDYTSNPSNIDFNFLGYKIIHLNKKVEFCLSDSKIKRYKSLIEGIFKQYSTQSKKSSKTKAKKQMLMSLNYLTKNFYLSGSKSDIKTGIYFNNHLIDNLDILKKLDEYIKEKINNKDCFDPYDKLFKKDINNKDYNNAVKKIKESIIKRNSFLTGFKEKQFCKLNCNQIKSIKRHLIQCEKK